MPSFASSPIATNSAASGHNGTFRATIISYARAILPSSLPAAFYDFVPFILAGLMALLFTALLVLLVEDSEDVYPHAPRNSNTRSSKSAKSPARKARIVGLAEHHQEELDEEAEEWDRNNAWNPRADLANSRNTRQSQQWLRIQQEKSLAPINPSLASYPYRTNIRLLTSPPTTAAPDSPAFTPPILSMAKMIMHRHDQYSKRSRSPSRASPPPSPPSGGSPKAMQYTLKSASIRTDKVAMIAFPPSPEERIPELVSLPPSRSPSPPTSPLRTSAPASDKISNDTSFSPSSSPSFERSSKTPTHTRTTSSHARSRAVALSPVSVSLALPTLPSLKGLPPSLKDMSPSLVSPLRAFTPALQMFQSQSTQDRTVRRRTSGLLEEGGSSTDLECQKVDASSTSLSPSPASASSNSRKPKKRSRKTSNQKRSGHSGSSSFTYPANREGTNNNATKSSDPLVDLEEGSHGRSR